MLSRMNRSVSTSSTWGDESFHRTRIATHSRVNSSRTSTVTTGPAITGPVMHEFIGPDMVRALRMQLDAGAVIEPQRPHLGTFSPSRRRRRSIRFPDLPAGAAQ